MVMSDLIAELIGSRVCLLFDGRQETGILRGVGDGLLCLDLDADGEQPIRVFYSLAHVTAFRAAVNDDR